MTSLKPDALTWQKSPHPPQPYSASRTTFPLRLTQAVPSWMGTDHGRFGAKDWHFHAARRLSVSRPLLAGGGAGDTCFPVVHDFDGCSDLHQICKVDDVAVEHAKAA